MIALAVGAGCSALAARPPPKSEAERLYLAKCSSCHVPFEPHEFPRERWPGLVAEHTEEARLKPEEAALILSYLTGEEGR